MLNWIFRIYNIWCDMYEKITIDAQADFGWWRK